MLLDTPAPHRALKDFAVCLSLANLLCLHGVTRLENPAMYYYRKSSAGMTLGAYFLAVLGVGLAAWLVMELVQRARSGFLRRLGQAILLVLFLLGLNSARTTISAFTVGAASTKTIPVLLAGFGSFAFLAVTRFERLLGIAKNVLLIAFLLIPMIAAESSRLMLEVRSGMGDRQPAPLLKITGPARVLALVFDEMDERLAFLSRPTNVKLPELDGLREQSFYATAAHSAGPTTTIAMPALFTGRRVIRIKPRPDDLLLTFEGEPTPAPWSAQPTIFSQARLIGANTALVGWNHPYCRILGSSLTRCAWTPATGQDPSDRLEANLLYQSQSLLGALPLAMRLKLSLPGDLDRRDFTRAYLDVRQSAMRFARDPQLQLVVVHWPIPHPPGIYDPSSRRLTLDTSSDYLDNLMLADKVLGEVRREMESAGIWDTTTVLVTADHHYRTEYWRNDQGGLSREMEAATQGISRPLVPFLVKLPGQKRGAAYDAPFSNILLHDLVLDALRQQFHAPEDIVRWMDEKRSTIPVE